jgi:hypothetical protein
MTTKNSTTVRFQSFPPTIEEKCYVVTGKKYELKAKIVLRQLIQRLQPPQ